MFLQSKVLDYLKMLFEINFFNSILFFVLNNKVGKDKIISKDKFITGRKVYAAALDAFSLGVTLF